MAGKKSLPVRPNAAEGRVDTEIRDLGEKETIVHYNAVMIEDLGAKMTFVIEALRALEQKMNTRFNEVDARFDEVDARLNNLTSSTNGRFLTVEAAIRGLKGDIMTLDSKFDRLLARTDNHEHRLALLEQA